MGITAEDIRDARKIGCVVKLLAICERTPDGVSARVHPTLVPRSHPLASVHDAFNAVFLDTTLAGELMFYGQGAGAAPTASAVLGDLVQAARHRIDGGHGPRESAYADLPILPIARTRTSYFIRLDVLDRPGVLARVANVFGAQDVSIESMRQGIHRSEDGMAILQLVTHQAPDAALAATVEGLRKLDDVHEVSSVLRVEGL
jgi:homoserine dehydrogenase